MHAQRQQPLVSVERQSETNLATGETQTRMFVKMYFEARDSGLLADIGDIRWRTLCCLATYMDADGHCRPSQARIARDLGISRQQANKRIRSLAEYRFEGRAVLRIEKTRRVTAAGGRWGNNVYSIQPISGLGIFADRNARKPSLDESSPVSSKRDTGRGAVSVRPDTRVPDTNKSQIPNQNHTRCDLNSDENDLNLGASGRRLVEKFHRAMGHAATRKPSARELKQASRLVAHHGVETAQSILDFAVSRARQTRFAMETFGAVLQYVDDALASKRRLARRPDRVDRKSARDAFYEWRRNEIERLRSAASAEDMSALEEAVTSALNEEGIESTSLGFDLLVRSRVDSLLSLDAELTREDFRRAKSSDSHSRGLRKAS